MNWFQKALGRWFAARNSLGHGFVLTSGASNNLDPGTIRQLIEKCPPVSTAIGIISRIISNLPVHADSAAVQKLLDEPNEIDDRASFLNQIIHYTLGFGNCIIRMEKSGNGKIRRLYAFEPGDFQIELSEGPRKFLIYRPKTYSGPDLTSSDVIHLKDHTISFGALAKSRVELMESTIRTLVHLDSLQANIYRKGNNLNYFLKFLPGTGRDAMKKSIDEFNASFTGPQSSSRNSTAGFEGVELKEIRPPSFSDYDGINVTDQLISRIACGFSISPFLLTGNASQKYSNAKIALANFHRDGILPIVNNLEKSLTRNLRSQVTIDSSRVLLGDFEDMVKVAAAASNRPLITLREARERILGWPEEVEAENMDMIPDRPVSGNQLNGDDRRGENADQDQNSNA